MTAGTVLEISICHLEAEDCRVSDRETHVTTIRETTSIMVKLLTVPGHKFSYTSVFTPKRDLLDPC